MSWFGKKTLQYDGSLLNPHFEKDYPKFIRADVVCPSFIQAASSPEKIGDLPPNLEHAFDIDEAMRTMLSEQHEEVFLCEKEITPTSVVIAPITEPTVVRVSASGVHVNGVCLKIEAHHVKITTGEAGQAIVEVFLNPPRSHKKKV